MKTALATYKEILAEFGVTTEVEVSPVAKSTYLLEQIQQQKAILNRLFFDAATAKFKMDEAKDDVAKDAHRKKLDDYKNDIRQILGALKINLQLQAELADEHPELKPEA